MAALDEPYTNFSEVGKYFCSGCENYLYKSGDKIQSPGNKPAFAKAATDDSVALEEDFSVGILRTVILCKKCNKEIGHVYNDGQKDGAGAQQRHTVPSKNLRFEANPEGGEPASASTPVVEAPKVEVVEKRETATGEQAAAPKPSSTAHSASAPGSKRSAAQARQLLQNMSDSDDSDSSDSDSSEDEKPAAKKAGGNGAKPPTPAAKTPAVTTTVSKKPEKGSSALAYLGYLAVGAAAVAAGFVGYRVYLKREGVAK